MSRRSNGTEPPTSRRDPVGVMGDGSPARGAGAATRERETTTTNANVHFLPIRSRVGKRFQAQLPVLQDKPSMTSSSSWKKAKVMHVAKPRYSLDKATALGSELDKYLKLARSLRDGATFDTEEQISTLALEYLHRFEYNPTDAACSLYARHSMEVPKAASTPVDVSSSRNVNGIDVEVRWLTSFYRIMRLPRIHLSDYHEMADLHAKAVALGMVTTEVGVLERLVNRLTLWLDTCAHAKDNRVERVELQELVYQAEDLTFVVNQKTELEARMRAFDVAYGRLKDAIDRNNRRNQSKSPLEELEELFAAVQKLKVNFPEEPEYTKILADARELKTLISNMLVEDKVSLTAMRDVIGRIELVPVNFEKEVDMFQQKMLTAQTWLAKVRKCIPKRRTSRRGGSSEPKKMDLEAIRALVVDAPCEDSAEMFEMQDLLECADEWAEKVKRAIEGGADVTLEELKELMEEGNEMPVDMDEQKYLDAEIAAREWCTSASAMLAAKKPLRELEVAVEAAKAIRQRLHPKRQSRWKPQVERDVHSALDVTRRWVHDVRDVLGASVFDRLFASSSSSTTQSLADVIAASTSHATHVITSDLVKSEGSAVFTKGKKSVETVTKLLDKADRLGVDVSMYVTRLHEVLALTATAQRDAVGVLVHIGVRTAPVDGDNDTNNEVETVASDDKDSKRAGEFTHACALLDRIASLPLVFAEAIELYDVLSTEKDWALRVRDALPPRQSRKKRTMKDPITLEQLRVLLDESTQLRFQFPDEMKILTKELEEIAMWQVKARECVTSQVDHMVENVVKTLREYDLMVCGKLREAKEQQAQQEPSPDPTTSHETVDTTKSEPTKDVEMEDVAQAAAGGAGRKSIASTTTMTTTTPTGSVATSLSLQVDAIRKREANIEATRQSMPAWIEPPIVLDQIHVDAILDTIRREAGCAKRAEPETAKEGEDAKEATSKDDKTTTASPRRAFTLLDPLLALAEESIVAVNGVEVKEDARKSAKKLDDLVSVAPPPEDAVKQLEMWHATLTQIVEEGSLFNAVAPELEALTTVVELLEWYQSARSIFFDEVLPLRGLVAQGTTLEARLADVTTTSPLQRCFEATTTVERLTSLLYPLPHLVDHERVVQAWRLRVAKCLEDKHAPIDEIQALLVEATHGLLLEPDAFKVIVDEVKKAKLWLAKLKKRLKALLSKHVTRLTMAMAKTLVEEGEDIALELPAFELLKEHVETASDWERRVLESGIETGQARIATLLQLLDEYDRARLVIDLDMHRDVLQSATERYCVCRQPYDGFMIGCDFCEDWFHDNCIGMSKEKAEKVEHYTCPSCLLLQDLAKSLRRTMEGQSKLWSDQDYVKTYEKQNGAAQRKVKREEKAIERSEMLLFSCNNHMNQLRTRIEDIERAKACLSLKNPFETTTATTPLPVNRTSVVVAGKDALSSSEGETTEAAPSGATTTTTPTQLTPLAPSTTATAPSNTTGAVLPPPPPPPASGVPMDTMAFVQRYPNILLPSTKVTLPVPNDSKQQVQPTTTTTTTTTTTNPTMSLVSTPGGGVVGESLAMPTNMLAPMLAKLSENTERLSALLVAGGVEQQLAKMKTEHAEVKAQVHELHEAIRVSKERLATAQQGLDELKRAFLLRQHGIPRAKAWVQRVITVLNDPVTLQRVKFQSSEYMSTEFVELLLDARAKEIAHFAEVKAYMHVLRLVGWTLVVVALLQERPSREALTDAIAYAGEHELCESRETINPLRAIIARVDVWIARIQKCLGKQAGGSSSHGAQKLTRIKAMMNEYTKLPLTCAWIGTLEAYVQVAETESSVSEHVVNEKEAAAIAAVATALAQGAPTIVPKAPRKRKSYTRKEKVDGEAGAVGTPPAGSGVKRAKKGSSASSSKASTPTSSTTIKPEEGGEEEDVAMADASPPEEEPPIKGEPVSTIDKTISGTSVSGSNTMDMLTQAAAAAAADARSPTSTPQTTAAS